VDTAKEAEDIEKKEMTPEAPAETPAVETTPVAETTTPVVTPAPAEDEKKEKEEPPITREEIADALKSILDPAFEQINILTDKVKELSEKLDKVNTDTEDKAKELLDTTPFASLTQLFTNRAVGTSKTAVSSDDPLTKEKPKETQAPPPSETGVPFIDALIAGNGRK